MNILPLILALALMVAVLTVERLEKFKNHSIIQHQYQLFLKESERAVFNYRQRHLYGESNTSHRHLTFRYIFDKKLRDKHVNEAKQYRMLAIELMKVLYGEATFFKELEKKRGQFLDDMVTAIEEASEKSYKIKQIKDLARLELEDPELQEAFYRMLKGTISRNQLIEISKDNPQIKEKGYPSLFVFITNHGTKHVPTINIGKAPKELLKAIFIEDEIVNSILIRRKELSGKKKESGADETFKSEFLSKRRPGIDENLLDFKLSSSDTSVYD